MSTLDCALARIFSRGRKGRWFRGTLCLVRGEDANLHTIDLCAKALISLMARGARFLKVTPCICSRKNPSAYCPLISGHRQSVLVVGIGMERKTYSLVEVDGVLAGDHVGNGRAALLAGLLGGRRHFLRIDSFVRCLRKINQSGERFGICSLEM